MTNQVTELSEAYEERAAIIEFEAKLPRSVAESIAITIVFGGDNNE